MKRYFNSFFITLLIYASLGASLFYGFKDEKIVYKEIEKTKTISLKEISFTQAPQEIKKEEVKEEIKKEFKEKAQKKNLEKKKKIIKREVKKKPKKSIQKKVVTKKTKMIKKDKVSKTPQKTKTLVKNDELKKEDYLDKNLALITSLIKENIVYPKIARKRNIQGIVTVKFKILPNGKVENIQIISGHRFLQKATIKAINDASSSFPKVKKSLEIKLPIEFKLL